MFSHHIFHALQQKMHYKNQPILPIFYCFYQSHKSCKSLNKKKKSRENSFISTTVYFQ